MLNGQQAMVKGYEIHQGISTPDQTAEQPTPLITLDDGRFDGMLSADGQILGTYLHGVFDHPDALTLILNWAGCQAQATCSADQQLDQEIDRLTDALEAALDWDKAKAAGLMLP